MKDTTKRIVVGSREKVIKDSFIKDSRKFNYDKHDLKLARDMARQLKMMYQYPFN